VTSACHGSAAIPGSNLEFTSVRCRQPRQQRDPGARRAQNSISALRQPQQETLRRCRGTASQSHRHRSARGIVWEPSNSNVFGYKTAPSPISRERDPRVTGRKPDLSTSGGTSDGASSRAIAGESNRPGRANHAPGRQRTRCPTWEKLTRIYSACWTVIFPDRRSFGRYKMAKNTPAQ